MIKKLFANLYGGGQFFFKTVESISVRDGWLISHMTIVLCLAAFQTEKQNEK